MHPDPLFRETRGEILLASVVRAGLAHVFVSTPEGPMVAHVPLTLSDLGFRFHLARRNRLAPHLHGAVVLVSALGPHGYISPDWYTDTRNQVPTWDYFAVEAEAAARTLTREELRAQMEELSEHHEQALYPKPVWTMATLAPERTEAMLDALVGFELVVTAMRGTRKLSQNKTDADRANVRTELTARGNKALAGMIG